FLEKKNSFISFYINMTKGLFNINEFNPSKIPMCESLYAHYFNMLITERIIMTIKLQLGELKTDDNVFNSFFKKFQNILNFKISNESLENIDNPYELILKFAEKEKRNVVDFASFYFAKMEYKGCLTNYENYIIPFLKLIKELFKFNGPIYLLIDDAGHVFDFQQKVFNTWISNRHHETLSIKLASPLRLYKNFKTIDEICQIDSGNDFEFIHLDNYGSREEEKQKKVIREIIEKRISKIDSKPNIENFFLEDEEQKIKIKDAKNEAKNFAENKRKNEKNSNFDVERYVNRSYMQYFYKQLSSDKNSNESMSRNYCGLDDIIYFSEHNIRECLKVCSKIFSELYSTKKNIESFPFKIQNKVMEKISKDFYVGITLSKEPYPEKTVEILKNFVDSLGNLYRKRLLDINCVEYGVTTIQINDSELSEEQRNALKIGIEFRYFSRKFFTDKNDGTQIKLSYALNKMFFPKFKLELIPFSGRLSIEKTILSKAFTNSDEFMKAFNNDIADKYQFKLFEMQGEEVNLEDANKSFL
ncbi:MAG: hypothetical protein ACRC0V_08525, partial [Fusobacteriaceae bacterium]